MWFPAATDGVDWSEAEKYLSKADPALRKIIKKVGPCTLHPRRDYFVKLCQSIFSQQISTAAAASLFGRFRDQFPRRQPTPARVLEFLRTSPEEKIKSIGLSRQKRVYVEDLAERFATGQVPTRRFSVMDDEAIVQSLIPIKGIGRWTVEMFLIFCLNRTDVWPIDDLGVRKGVQSAYGMAEIPEKAELIQMGEKWRPWRTIATWYFWRHLSPA